MSARAQTQTSAQPVPAINAVSVGFLQRKCGCGSHTIAGEECSECRQKSGLLQRQAVNATQSPIPPIVPEVLSSPAHSLDPATRSFMEPRFGRDFSHVRVHTDAKASESAKAVGALAYTVGNDVVFAAGRYSPSTQDGRRLIAHELTHTLQQRGAPLQTALEVGRIDDPGEVEADRVAAAVMGSGSVPGVNAGPAGVLRRAPDEPKPLRTDIAHVPVSTTSEEKVHVIRKMMPCECRKVPDVREGVFYNPNLNALAIAYRHCSGGTRTDVYAEVQSNLSSFLAGGPPPTGTGRIGFEINVVGKKVGAKATLEVTGSNVTGGQGVGGRAQVVFQGDKWRVFVTSNFLHGLGANSGDVLDLNLGGRLGPITAELQVQNLLTPSPTTTGDVCADLPGTSIRACFEIFGSVGVGAGLKGPLGGPQRDRDECFQCLCPPPTKHYTCYHDVPPTEKQVEREIEVQVPHEHRFYFAL
ncbi:MAG TPA: DUF4157 domain-containing protein, partial [Pyrinomonadaceae bacterium]|nr:DUF4157 domain-containing protein [Pyrinomonadaceae bacterium]